MGENYVFGGAGYDFEEREWEVKVEGVESSLPKSREDMESIRLQIEEALTDFKQRVVDLDASLINIIPAMSLTLPGLIFYHIAQFADNFQLGADSLSIDIGSNLISNLSPSIEQPSYRVPSMPAIESKSDE